jgi:hypothetical protein
MALGTMVTLAIVAEQTVAVVMEATEYRVRQYGSELPLTTSQSAGYINAAVCLIGFAE